MPACMCHFECCWLFAWGIFSWHVSCAVKAYCVWVITCHRKPWALLTPPITPLLLLFHRSPTVFLSNPCQPCFSPFCLSSLSLSHFLLLFQSVYPARKVISGSWGWWVLWSVLFIYLFIFFHLIFPEGIQPWNNQCRSPWNFCQAWLQLPFVRHVTTGSRGCVDDDRSTGSLPPRGPCILLPHSLVLLCLFGPSGACCAQCGMMTLCIELFSFIFNIFSSFLIYSFSLFSLVYPDDDVG